MIVDATRHRRSGSCASGLATGAKITIDSAMREGGTMPAAMSAANEVAAASFLQRHIRFMDIPRAIAKAMEAHETHSVTSLEAVTDADAWARSLCPIKDRTLPRQSLQTDGRGKEAVARVPQNISLAGTLFLNTSDSALSHSELPTIRTEDRRA